MSYDPTQPVPPPIDPTQLESLPASSSPEIPTAPSSDFAETRLTPPPPPSGYVEPPPPPPHFSLRKDWPIAVLALLYVVGVIFAFLSESQTPSSSTVDTQSSAFILSEVLVIIALVGVLILDSRGYFSLRGWVQRRRNSSDRLILGCIWVLFCVIFLAPYFVRRFMGKPQVAPLPLNMPYGSAPMAAPMQSSGPYSGPLSGPIDAPVSGPIPSYMSGPFSGPSPAYVPAPVYMDPATPPPAPPQVIIVQSAQPPPAQLIRTYKGGLHSAQRAFQKDASKLALQGWRVHQVVTTQSKELTVIYQR